jgi:hypothetical protein
MVTFGKVCKGMGGAAHNVHKDIYKVGIVLLKSDLNISPVHVPVARKNLSFVRVAA